MTTSFAARLRSLSLGLLITASALLTGCASFYLDPATKDVPAAEMPKVAQPKPVKLNFEFQTRGAPNSAATSYLQTAVTDQIKATGLFSTLDAPPGGAILDVKLNNIPLNDDSPAAKGFVTGFTFGLVGSTVADGYECKISYLAPGQTTPIVKVTRHAIHTTLGASSPPPGTVRVDSANDAVMKMTHAVISNALRDLAKDPGFQ